MLTSHSQSGSGRSALCRILSPRYLHQTLSILAATQCVVHMLNQRVLRHLIFRNQFPFLHHCAKIYNSLSYFLICSVKGARCTLLLTHLDDLWIIISVVIICCIYPDNRKNHSNVSTTPFVLFPVFSIGIIMNQPFMNNCQNLRNFHITIISIHLPQRIWET